ncbi:MAG: Hsp20 family protein [Sneathiella sp.]|nr:Hsp20 family protein [Sneathiella sp.]
MSRVSMFNSPLLLGFEHFEHILEQLAKSGGDGYPPYNIEHTQDNRLQITLAVAGFFEEDLKITLEQNQLIIHGKQKDEPDRVFLHRGIAARQFQKKFVLAEGVEVAGAQMDNGLLHIDLSLPEQDRHVKQIKISSKKSQRDLKTISGTEIIE